MYPSAQRPATWKTMHLNCGSRARENLSVKDVAQLAFELHTLSTDKVSAHESGTANFLWHAKHQTKIFLPS